jgi:hypothetical protein
MKGKRWRKTTLMPRSKQTNKRSNNSSSNNNKNNNNNNNSVKNQSCH